MIATPLAPGGLSARDRVVYSTSPVAPRGLSARSAPLPIPTPLARSASRSAYPEIASTFRGDDGKYHVYLNCAIPKLNGKRIEDSICKTCGFGYSHLIHQHTKQCDYCEIEQVAERAIALQQKLNINLGWRMSDSNTQDENRYRYLHHPK